VNDPVEHQFVVHAHSARGDGDDVLTELFQAGVDDALIQVDGERITVEFEREAATLPEAVMSAIHEIESVEGCRVVRIGQDDLVSLAEIGRRIGKTRESIRLLAAGDRGPGDFPAPSQHITSQQLWSWADVSAWLSQHGRGTRQLVAESQFLRALNAGLEARAATRGVEDEATRTAARSAVHELLEAV
jgi:hypothetical protein